MINSHLEVSLDAVVRTTHILYFLCTGGSRWQRLQLLFYILLPPKLLHAFLETHPAGGVPLWLLEVGNETVLSLASLSHYYWYGDVFSPVHSKTIQKQQQPHLVLNGNDAYALLESILTPSTSTENGSTPQNSTDTKLASPIRKTSSSLGIRRRQSQNSSIFPDTAPPPPGGSTH